eukprot:scaffold22778_cov36-Tisochrysis_lutea.AAC.3
MARYRIPTLDGQLSTEKLPRSLWLVDSPACIYTNRMPMRLRRTASYVIQDLESNRTTFRTPHTSICRSRRVQAGEGVLRGNGSSRERRGSSALLGPAPCLGSDLRGIRTSCNAKHRHRRNDDDLR